MSNTRSPNVTRVAVSGVRSRTHLIYVASYLRSLLDRGDVLEVSYLSGGRFIGAASVDQSDVLSLLPTSEQMHITMADNYVDWVIPADVIYVAVSAPGIKPWARLKATNPTGSIEVVVTDDGIGSYGNWRSMRASYARQGRVGWWAPIRASGVAFVRDRVTSVRWALYQRELGWAVDERVAAEFRRNVASPVRATGTVTCFTQPWVQLGVITVQAYLAEIQSLRSAVEAAGFEFMVRPHPGEPHSQYEGFAVSRSQVPAELDSEILGSHAVIGECSTALLNLASIHGIRAARLATPGLDFLDKELSKDQRALFERYVPDRLTARDLGRWLNEGNPPAS